MSAIPIPARLAGRPTVGGLVVPYISLEADGRTHLGGVRTARVLECIVDGLCQICGQRLTARPVLFLCTQSMIDNGASPEPALHPECAAYSVQACPMVAGRMPTYSKHPVDKTGDPCDTPGCNCGGWVTSNSGNEGRPAEPWFRVWATDYAIGISKPGPVTIATLTGAVFRDRIVKVRPIRTDATRDGTSHG